MSEIDVTPSPSHSSQSGRAITEALITGKPHQETDTDSVPVTDEEKSP